MARWALFKCQECGQVLDRDADDPLFTGRSYCSRTGKDVTLVEVTDGNQD